MRIVRFFSHEVGDVLPAIRYLRLQLDKGPTYWKVRYIMTIWLSLLALVPFSLTDITDKSVILFIMLFFML